MKNKRFKQWKGYVFDKYLFRAFMIIILTGLFCIVVIHDFDFSPNMYISCSDDNPVPCENPFYNAEIRSVDPYFRNVKCEWDWCHQEYLPVGFEFGKKPDFWITYAPYLSFLFLILAFVVNHIIYNKGYKFNINMEE